MGKTAASTTRGSGYRSEDSRDADMAAFAEIARIAEAASRGEEYAGGREEGVDAEGSEVGNSVAYGCQIKALPARLRQQAAKVAGRINPANSPLLQERLPEGIHVDSPLRLTLLTSKYWGPTPRRFTVSFMETTQADLRARILSHMNAWSKTVNKTFVETAGSGEIRISRGPGGYFSYLGTDVSLIPQNRQTMNLDGFTMSTHESEYRRVVRHETGHTLGFPHEHMRRELVARIDPEKAYPFFYETQGWDKATVDQQVLTSLDDRSIFGTAADATSCMCYQLPGKITHDGRPIIGGTDINATDYAFAGLIYPKVSFTPRNAVGVDEDDWDPSLDVQDVLV